MTTNSIDQSRVETLFTDSLFRYGEDAAGAVKAVGIVTSVGFHPGRLEAHKEEVAEMLAMLPDSFKASGGGGMSFLNACYDKNEVQWTGLHLRMEQLFLLGMALGLVRELMPRELWPVLPGGMPYYVVEVKP